MIFILMMYGFALHSSYSSNKSHKLIFWVLGVWFHSDQLANLMHEVQQIITELLQTLSIMSFYLIYFR